MIISTSNATLEIPSLHPCILNCYFSSKIHALAHQTKYLLIVSQFLFHKQYIFGCLFSTGQSILYFFFPSPNWNNLQSFKSNRCKKLIDATCFDECSDSMWKPEDAIFIKVCHYSEIFATAILLLFLKQVFWNKPIFYVISMITVQC